MNAFHVFWTLSQEKRDFKDYFVLTLILSVMQWRKTNPGRLTFYGDRSTVEYLEKYRLCDLWSACDGETLDRLLKGKEAAFTHWEEPDVSSLWYCGPEKLSVGPGYRFHSEWDFTQTAANTSFIYFKEDWLKEYYVECVLEYMYDNFVRNPVKENPELIFVEQRLLTMCWQG